MTIGEFLRKWASTLATAPILIPMRIYDLLRQSVCVLVHGEPPFIDVPEVAGDVEDVECAVLLDPSVGRHPRFVVAWSENAAVQFTVPGGGLEHAKKCFSECRGRRLLLDMESGPTDVGGTVRPWKEVESAGEPAAADEEIRDTLVKVIS